MVAGSFAIRRSQNIGNASLGLEQADLPSDADANASSNLYGEIDDAIRASLASRRLQEADRQDCIQETWLAILGSRMSGFRGGDPRAWAATLARNKAIDTMRGVTVAP